MLIYFILALLIIVLGFVFEKKNRRIYSFIVCILLTIVSGLRHYSIGNDTLNYVDFFNKIEMFNHFNINIWNYFEYGYVALNIVIRKITSSYTILLLVISFFINSSFCNFVKKYSTNMGVSFLLLLVGRFFFNEMNIMRQYIAIAVCLYSLTFLFDNKRIKFLIGVIFSSLFHRGSLIMLLLLIIDKIKLNTKNKIIIISLFVLAFLNLDKTLLPFLNLIGNYSHYFSIYYNSNKIGSVIVFIIFLLLNILIELICKGKTISKKDMFIKNIVFLLLNFSLIAIRMSIFDRIVNYFSYFIIIAIPNFLSYIDDIKKRKILTFIIIILFAIYTVVICYYRPGWNRVTPYSFFWN